MCLTLVTTCDNMKQRVKNSLLLPTMLLKSATDHVAEMNACQAQLNRELKQVQEEADWEGKEHAEAAA